MTHLESLTRKLTAIGIIFLDNCDYVRILCLARHIRRKNTPILQKGVRDILRRAGGAAVFREGVHGTEVVISHYHVPGSVTVPISYQESL